MACLKIYSGKSFDFEVSNGQVNLELATPIACYSTK